MAPARLRSCADQPLPRIIQEKTAAASAISTQPSAFEIVSAVTLAQGPGNGTEKTMQVTVPASGAAKADFSFSAATAGNPSSLEMMPALEVPMAMKH